MLCPPDQEAKLGPVAHQHGAKLQLLEPAQGGRQLAAGAGGSLRAQGLVGQGQGEAGGVPDLLGDVGGSSTEGALIIYTSGTTGKPKGVLHTHRWALGWTGWGRVGSGHTEEQRVGLGVGWDGCGGYGQRSTQRPMTYVQPVAASS